MKGIQIIFDWVLVSSAMASIMVFIILLFNLILKNKVSAACQYYVWILLLIRLMIPYAPESHYSVFNFVKLPAGNAALSTGTEAGSDGITLPGITEEKSSKEAITQVQPYQQNKTVNKESKQFLSNHLASFYKNMDVKSVLIPVWLAGVILVALYVIIINLRLLLKIQASPRLCNDAINRIFNECKSIIGVNDSIPIVLCKSISTPSLFGIIRPRLLLPYDIYEKLNADDLKYIFLHELAHLKQKDLAINWITVSLKILHWFNPFVWYGFYKMHQNCEMSCDALVLSRTKQEEHVEYGYTIVRLLKLVSKTQRIPGTTGLLTSKSQMKRRIMMISLFKQKGWKWSVTAIAVIAAISLFTLTNAKSSSENVQSRSTEQKESLPNSEKDKDVPSGIKLLDIEGKGFDGKILIIRDPKKIAVGYNFDDSNLSKTTSQIADEFKAVAAINAGGFGYAELDNSAYKPYGIIIHQGKVIFDDTKNNNAKHDVVGFTDDGKMITGKYTITQLEDRGVKEAVSFGPSLIVNGKPAITKGDGGWGIAPRTAIGQKADGSVIFLVINGRSLKSLGATLKDIQDILLEQGAVTASNLDGGSSSTMYLNGKVINRPSDSSGERSVPTIFMTLP